jgi:putative SOS response-associated peptidase YedK
MCGRFILTSPVESLAKIFGFSERPNLAPRYNIAPTQLIAAVRTGDEGERHLAVLHWGLVPFWAKEKSIGARMINARAETAAEKPAFRAAFRHRRCLVPANGFYEWQRAADGGKQPYLIRRPDGEPFAFAGLWESWESKENGEVLESCSILTTDANRTLEPIHHRMPVILNQAGVDAWLAPGSERGKELQALLKPAPDDLLEAFPVSREVNKVANDSPALLDPVSLAEAAKNGGTEQKKADPPAKAKKQGELF